MPVWVQQGLCPAGCRSKKSTSVPTQKAQQARAKQRLMNQALEFGIKFTKGQYIPRRVRSAARLGVGTAGEKGCAHVQLAFVFPFLLGTHPASLFATQLRDLSTIT